MWQGVGDGAVAQRENFDGGDVMHPAGVDRFARNNDLKGMGRLERLAVAVIGEKNFARAKFRIQFGQGKNGLIIIGGFDDDDGVDRVADGTVARAQRRPRSLQTSTKSTDNAVQPAA